MEKTAKKFRSFAEAEQADRDFYKKLTGSERLQILVDLLGPLQGDGRIDRNYVKRRKLGGSEIGELSDSPRINSIASSGASMVFFSLLYYLSASFN